MTTPPEPPPLLPSTATDAGLDRILRRSLTTLREQHAGTPFAEMLGDVLAGRSSLRDVARTPQWDSVVGPAAQKMAEQWAELPRAERERLAEQGREELEREREQAFVERYPDRP